MDKNREIEIESRVDKMLDEIGYQDTNDDVDLFEIARLLGIAVGNAMLNNDDDGFIIVNEGVDEILGIKTDKLIGVNSQRSLEWKRFIIAHEIAHYILHYSKEKDKGIYAHREHKKGKDEIENEADFFAANLLMPRERFINKFNELKSKGLSMDDICLLLEKKFIVTPKMLVRRIGELELNG